MVRIGLRVWAAGWFVVGSLTFANAPCNAVPLDAEGDINFGVRTYVNARVGTENTHDGVPSRDRFGKVVTSTSATFPHSASGHLRQNRVYIEAEIKHSLDRLVQQGIGPLSLLNDLPFKVKGLAYHLTFRGEGDGVYDWGPREYSTADEFEKLLKVPAVAANQGTVDVLAARRTVRKLGVHRERLFQAYAEGAVGGLFLRFGRQVLSWGETDAFQLIDHINPIDSSFGGFLISLDERRVPLDMLLGNYYLGDLGPLSEIHLEGFVAVDNKVGFAFETPPGSPWALPGAGHPSSLTKNFPLGPSRTLKDARGGAQLKFNLMNATFGLAHYYTYFDIPAVQVFTSEKGVAVAFDDGLPCPRFPSDPSKGTDPTRRHCGFPTHALLTAPRVQVSGATTTFALPRFFNSYPILRSEIAYFKDEPAFTQGQLDPFIFNRGLPDPSGTTGGRRLRDSINAAVGIDTNQWIRLLNPNQTFFISTQFFYKHILNGASGRVFNSDGSLNPDREVLPVSKDLLTIPLINTKLEPVFISHPTDQFLHTLLIGTSYRSGTIHPVLTLFYDWGGGLVYQPSVTFTRDPFRFAIDYSIIDAHSYKGGSGVSLLKDRDNIQFRFEYVI